MSETPNFNVPYMLKMLAEIYGRENGMDLKAIVTPKEASTRVKTT